ncbi:hypothetical protein PACTADRAFT_1643 [Pachysolen tannophilus NRRL Y-2460]|uniref:Uncharacterized protein n=1 Tax=Pachysolen tannophilus NRRL Y-2460 TaxID=669874 RepID=A0A1E4TZ87_PACTA|nr:hypothetical protein PACTADRAFT_1643 [Pachysolen tannophilus NRRL Y-2460]
MNGDQGVIFRDIPIVAYPPFKLRSSLIDKDPVIWVHLIEYYITLFQKLIDIYASRDEKLSVKSQQQLFEFLKTYLGETAEESIKIFSLGSINPDIISNSKILKLYVFEFVKRVNLINLQFNGETIWNFVKVYSKLSVLNDKKKSFPVTLELVRKLVDGSLKSKLNYNSDNISLITTLQKYLENLIGSGKFNKFDLETLSLLLGQYVHNTKENNHKPVIVNNKNNNNRKNFNEVFK